MTDGRTHFGSRRKKFGTGAVLKALVTCAVICAGSVPAAQAAEQHQWTCKEWSSVIFAFAYAHQVGNSSLQETEEWLNHGIKEDVSYEDKVILKLYVKTIFNMPRETTKKEQEKAAENVGSLVLLACNGQTEW